MGGSIRKGLYETQLEVSISLSEAATADVRDTRNALVGAVQQAIRNIPENALSGFQSLRITLRSAQRIAK
jgi:hypothetical protein